MRKQLGDFQTPPALAKIVVDCVTAASGNFERALEPTCGTGSFLRALAEKNVSEIVGLDLQQAHIDAARSLNEGLPRISLYQGDIFRTDMQKLHNWSAQGRLLIIGNPPWVTNSALSVLGSDNRPNRRNLKALNGFDALTGESNFDIAEAIWIRLIEAFSESRPTIALLCKTLVARNVLQYASSRKLPIGNCSIRRINSKEWFDASVDACLFQLTVGVEPDYRAPVYGDLFTDTPDATMAVVNNRIVPDLETYQKFGHLAGEPHITWRQGVKHDASAIMEFREAGCCFRNGLGQEVDLESAYVYPLMKSTDLHRGTWGGNNVLLPQKALGEDTSVLSIVAPKIAAYLHSHGAVLAERKSSIYKSQPRYAIFGIGPYCFRPYKVAVSAFHKEPRFRLLGSMNGKPVQVDDTSYYLPCESIYEAALLGTALNSDAAQRFLKSLSLAGSKRMITKGVLQRLDLRQCIASVDPTALLEEALRFARAETSLRLDSRKVRASLEELINPAMDQIPITQWDDVPVASIV